MQVEANGADISYGAALAETLACYKAKELAIDVEALFDAFARYKVTANQPPPMDWVRSPESMTQVLAVECALVEMADRLT
jgi:hypothetical protein